MSIKKTLTAVAVSSLFSFNAHAEIIVAPHCLVNKLTAQYIKLAATSNLELIQTDKKGLQDLIKNKMTRGKPCGGFINVTAAYHQGISAMDFLKSYESAPVKAIKQQTFTFNHAKEVTELYNLLTPNNMWSNLTEFSSFNDRYSNSDTGVKSGEWVKKQLENMINLSGRKDLTVFTVVTKGYKQPSIVVKMGNDFSKPGIVLGSHMDSVEADSESRPAADDDGSGTVTLLETFRTLLTSGMTFKKPLYFIWYAAEEEGLIGSQNVVKYFKDNKIAVDYAFNFDMTGYAYQNERTLYLISDNTDSSFNSLLEKLEKEYVKQPVRYATCGYACSDHATWMKAGVKAAFPFEGDITVWNIDPYIHTADDKIEVLSLDHMTDFAKLALAFVAEVGLA